MNTIKNNLEAVKWYLNDLYSNEQVNIHNEYCRENDLGDDEIYSNDEEFFNMFFEGKVIEAVSKYPFLNKQNTFQTKLKLRAHENSKNKNQSACKILQ